MTRDIHPAVRRVLTATIVIAIAILGVARPVAALEVGQPAPPFTLPATTGGDVSLSDFRGKKFVLLEFYGADFAPT